MIDLDNLQKMIDEKYISVQKHPTLDLFIYNYTQRAQFDRVWNNETLQCRGLIMDKYHAVIARPFHKFFNLQEHLDKGGQIPAEDFVVTEKMDGSLGILYQNNFDAAIATRGSFISDQAIHATELMRKKYKGIVINTAWTYLFEIIYPQNRIVVDYKGMDDLVLLSIIETEGNIELPYQQVKEIGKTWGMPVVEKYDAIKDFSTLEERANSEGYVISFPSSGQRFKIKFDEYVRLHRLITGVNARSIWDILRSGGNMDELLDRVPDEFYVWVAATKKRLEEEFSFLRKTAGGQFVVLTDTLGGRKEIAMHMNQNGYNPVIRSAVFAMMDNKPEEKINEIIWKSLKPKHEVPFKEDIDA